MWIAPRRKVPAVSTTARASMVSPSFVTTPAMRPPRITNDAAVPCAKWRLGRASRSWRTARRYSARSHWARGDQTAGPFERFSMRNWIRAMSVARPITPPSASTSRTTVPLAMPPMAGLHDICPIVSRFCVSMSVRAPAREASAAASAPAWPPPMMITSICMEGSID